MARLRAAKARDSDQPTRLGDAPVNDVLSAGMTMSDAATNFQPTTTDTGK